MTTAIPPQIFDIPDIPVIHSPIIPDFHIPFTEDPEERRAFATQQIATYGKYMLDRVAPQLVPHLMQAEFINLTGDDKTAFNDWVEAECNGADFTNAEMRQNRNLAGIMDRIERTICTAFPPGGTVFTRLNSRSPKHAWTNRYDEKGRQLPSRNAFEALKCFVASERILEDLLDNIPADAPLSIVLRPYVTMDHENEEFRVFIENGAITGMSPMFIEAPPSAYLKANAGQIGAKLQDIANFIAGKLSHLGDYCADIYLPKDGPVQIIEINPPPRLGTDPLIFRNHPFTGQFLIQG